MCRDEEHKRAIAYEDKEFAGVDTLFRPLYAIPNDIIMALEFLTWWAARGKDLSDAIEPIDAIKEAIKDSVR